MLSDTEKELIALDFSDLGKVFVVLDGEDDLLSVYTTREAAQVYLDFIKRMDGTTAGYVISEMPIYSLEFARLHWGQPERQDNGSVTPR